MKFEIKNRFAGAVIFYHEQENNSIKVTIELAIKSHANLSGADLSHADLYGANLHYANLHYADLSG